jgi:hypothetical protein
MSATRPMSAARSVETVSDCPYASRAPACAAPVMTGRGPRKRYGGVIVSICIRSTSIGGLLNSFVCPAIATRPSGSSSAVPW